MEILSVKYLGYCRARCKRDRMEREMKGTGISPCASCCLPCGQMQALTQLKPICAERKKLKCS